MSFYFPKIDALGDFFGNARRRKIEAAAQRVLLGGSKPVAVDFGVLGTRLIAGATVALLSATLNHSLPSTAGGILTVAGIGLTGALPTALKASGLRTALSPDTLSAVQGLGQAISGVLAAPANKKKAAFQAAVAQQVQIELTKTNMNGFALAELGRKAPDVPEAALGATGGSSAGAGGAAAIAAPGMDAAILATGGNQ